MKNVKAIVALALALLLLLPALAPAEADAARFEELVAANSMQARFDRHGSMQTVKTIYFEDGTTDTQTHIMGPESHFYIQKDGLSTYSRPDLFLRNDPEDLTMIIAYLFDSEAAGRDFFESGIEGWDLGVSREALVETDEADGVFTARTVMTDPDAVDALLAQRANAPECYEYGKGMALAFDYTFDAETGDLLKAAGELVDGEGNAHVLDVDEYTYDAAAFDPAAADSPFARCFAAPEGVVDLTLRFVDDGTEMRYTMSHDFLFVVVHGENAVDLFLDEACTQPYEGGNQLDELMLYVK